MAGAGDTNQFQLRYSITEHQATLRPIIDGVDLLEDYKNDQGLDPDRLLPPLSSLLFPTRAGRQVLIGVCSCGETGCGSLALWVRRVASEVKWEPVEVPPDETILRNYRFDLTQYLEAVDRAADDPPGEGRGRRVARMVRLMLGLHDQRYDVLTHFHVAKIDWISAWPWRSETVKVSLSSDKGQDVREFSGLPGESDQHLASRIAREVDSLRLGRASAS